MTNFDIILDKAESLPLSDWEIGDTLDVIDSYDQEHIVHSHVDGAKVIATGMVSCGDLVSVRDIEVE